jgi:hypothetical protein
MKKSRMRVWSCRCRHVFLSCHRSSVPERRIVARLLFGRRAPVLISAMDIMVAHQNLQLLEGRIATRLADARVDRDLIEQLYVMQGRYLEFLPPQELLARYTGLVQNLAYLLDAKRDEPPVHCAFISSWWWIERYIQMHKEFALRDMGDVPFNLDIGLIGEPQPPFIAPGNDRVFRFRQRVHLESTLSVGRIRIAPASQYKDTGLNAAQSDNELHKPHFSHGSKVKVQTLDGKPLEVKGFLEYAKQGQDYYILHRLRVARV